MGQRVIVGLESGIDWPALRARLEAHGAAHVSTPSAAQPDAVVATLADATDPSTFIARATALRGVRYAEPDSFQSTT